MALITHTAPERHIAPEHDGIVRYVLTDGRLTGCTPTVSGSAFSVSTGYWLVSGRLVQNTAVATVAIPSGSGNYAFLILTLNTAANPIASLSVVRNSTNEFPELTQYNLNSGAGTVYQIVLAAAVYSGSTWSKYYELNFTHGNCIRHTVGINVGDWTTVGSEKQVICAPTPPWPEPSMAIEAFPAPANRKAWIDAGCYLYSVGIGTLTFRAASTPSSDMIVSIRGF